MATQTIQITLAESGLMLRAQVYTGENGAVVTHSNVAVTAFAPGVYRLTLADSSGIYRLHLEDTADSNYQLGIVYAKTSNVDEVFQAGEYASEVLPERVWTNITRTLTSSGGGGDCDLSGVEDRLDSIGATLQVLGVIGLPVAQDGVDSSKISFRVGETRAQIFSLFPSYTGNVTITFETLSGVNRLQSTTDATGATLVVVIGPSVTANALLGRWAICRTDTRLSLAAGTFEVAEVAR